MQKLQRQFADTISNYGLLGTNERVLLGVSGGPDSVAMLDLFLSTNRVSNIYSELFIAHLNHLLRGEESEQDEQFVKDLAEKLNLPIIVERKNIKEVSHRRKLSLEETAREERYKFLETAAQKVGANVVIVGHTADDNAETILHRIIRGSGIMGLKGMSPKRKISPHSGIKLIRPLLFSWRKDIINYLEEKDISYRTDSTNKETDKFRNRIRMELMPLLEKNYNVGIKESLVRLGEISTQNYGFLKSQADDLFEKVVINNNVEDTDKIPKEIILDINSLEKIPAILQQIIIREAMSRIGISLKKFGHKHYKKILDMVGCKRTLINKGIKGRLNLSIDGNVLCLTNGKRYEEEKPIIKEVRLQAQGDVKLIGLKYKVKTETGEITNGFLEKFKQTKTRYEEAIDFDKIKAPLAIRSRRDGDRFWPLGAGGAKKLKDFFIDNKIPVNERNTIPIVTMNDQPIWVVGYRIDDRVKITKATKTFLVIRFKKQDIR